MRKAIYSGFPEEIYGSILKDYDDFEAPRPDDLEARLARLIDSLAGNFVSESTARILKLRVIPRARSLIEALDKKGDGDAADEVRDFVVFHLQQYQALGVDIDSQMFAR